MTVAKSPAMPLYGKDAWSDERFLLLGWDAQGLFWRLAFLQWMEGSIPDNLEAVVDIVGKARLTRSLWPQMLKFFVPVPDSPGRLYNLITNGHRERMLAERQRKQLGADMTNANTSAKRTGERPAKRTGERSVDDTAERVASRALPAGAGAANATGVDPDLDSDSLQKQGSEKILTPQQAAVKRVLDALEQHTTAFLVPDPRRVAKWVSVYGVDAIAATIAEEGMRGTLDGKNGSYLQQIIESRIRSGDGNGRHRTQGKSGRTNSPKTPGAVSSEFAIYDAE